MTRRSAVAVALIGLALIVGFTACGGDDDSSAGEGTTTEATTTEGTTTSEDTTTSDDDTTTGDDDGSEAASLEGETGPGFEIKLRQDGEDVETLEAGTYTISVEDQSEMHNFRLTGPGVNEEVTDVPFVGERSMTVTLQAGTYTFQCDPHAAQMNGTFTVS
jgi:plastocyanin